MTINLGPTINIIWGVGLGKEALNDHHMSMKSFFTLTMNNVFDHTSSKIYEESGYDLNLDCLSILY
jgi:hypothetical protein